MIAKLKAFITPEQVSWAYADSDKSVAADYARTVAAYRQHDMPKALSLMDRLLAREPQNPYFHELKGQMLFEFGQIGASAEAYKNALEIKKDAPLIRIAYAHALIESGKNLDEAIAQLSLAEKDEAKSTRLHRLFATAYGQKGQNALAQLHLAEESLLKQDFSYAKRQASAAMGELKENSRPWLRARDILNFAENQKDKEDKE
jgi:predicted Zn-dependent protease